MTVWWGELGRLRVRDNLYPDAPLRWKRLREQKLRLYWMAKRLYSVLLPEQYW